MSYNIEKRLAEPGEDDYRLERMEIEFAIPVYITIGQQQRFAELIEEICRAPMNTPEYGIHWQSGLGSKPKWSQADSRFLGRSVDPTAPETGEPSYDDSVFHFETSAREAYPEELARDKRDK